MPPQLINWLLLLFLVAVWGTSFLSTAIAINGGLSPELITLFRILFGAMVLTIVVYLKGLRLPLTLKAWGCFLLLGFFGSAAPFFLISWGQQAMPSGLTGLLMSSMPLVTMLLAHYLVPDEPLNRYKIAGFLVAFSGVFILLNPSSAASPDIWSAIAILTASSCYALNTILIRMLPTFNPLIAGAGMLLCALMMFAPLPLAQGIGAISLQLQQANLDAILAVIWTGLIPTGIASIVYFIVVERAGPSFLSNCNFLIPVVAVFAGALILGESITLTGIGALVIILSGIGLTRFRA